MWIIIKKNKKVKIQALDLSYFRSKSHFEVDDTWSYLKCQLFFRYFKAVANTNTITASKSNRLLDESIKPPLTSDNSLNSGMKDIDNAKIQVKFWWKLCQARKSDIKS